MTFNTVRPTERRSDQAYRAIKLAILNGALYPGALLQEQELIDRFQFGRTPIREAVQRLITEGLIYNIPRKGVFVTQITSNDVRDVYEMRCKLDTFAAELAARRASDQEINEMLELIENSSEVNESEKVFFDDKFHALYYHASHNSELEKSCERLYQQSVRLFSLKGYQRETLDSMRYELKAIAEAIRDRDPRLAAEAALRHIKSRDWFEDIKNFATDEEML